MTLDDELSRLWRKYEKAWGFEVTPGVRAHYEEHYGKYSNPDTAVEDLRFDLQRMGLLVKYAYDKGTQSSKKAGQHTRSYMGPLMKRVNLAKSVGKAFIDVGQDPNSDRHSWQPVTDKINADNPSERWTPDALKKAWHHAMSDTVVAGSVTVWLVHEVKGVPARATEGEY